MKFKDMLLAVQRTFKGTVLLTGKQASDRLGLNLSIKLTDFIDEFLVIEARCTRKKPKSMTYFKYNSRYYSFLEISTERRPSLIDAAALLTEADIAKLIFLLQLGSDDNNIAMMLVKYFKTPVIFTDGKRSMAMFKDNFTYNPFSVVDASQLERKSLGVRFSEVSRKDTYLEQDKEWMALPCRDASGELKVTKGRVFYLDYDLRHCHPSGFSNCRSEGVSNTAIMYNRKLHRINEHVWLPKLIAKSASLTQPILIEVEHLEELHAETIVYWDDHPLREEGAGTYSINARQFDYWHAKHIVELLEKYDQLSELKSAGKIGCLYDGNVYLAEKVCRSIMVNDSTRDFTAVEQFKLKSQHGSFTIPVDSTDLIDFFPLERKKTLWQEPTESPLIKKPGVSPQVKLT